MREPFFPDCYDEDEEFASKADAHTQALTDYLTGVFDDTGPTLVEDLAAGNTTAVVDLMALNCRLQLDHQRDTHQVDDLAVTLVNEAASLAHAGLLPDAAWRLEAGRAQSGIAPTPAAPPICGPCSRPFRRARSTATTCSEM